MQVGLTKDKRVRCRQIAECDVPAVVALLAGNSRTRSEGNWQAVLERMSAHATPEGYPKYGYLLESGGVTVGVLLVIFTKIEHAGVPFVRGNVSSWHVEPAFRAFAGLLTSHVAKFKDATIINVSPGPHTWPVIEAQGFAPIAAGVHIGVPLLGGTSAGATVDVVQGDRFDDACLPKQTAALLSEHAAYGCISLICRNAAGVSVVVFRKRRVLAWKVPVAELIYFDRPSVLSDFARPIGKLLARRGLFLIQADADGPIPGLPGRFFRRKMVKYFRGPNRPRIGDIAFTEAGMLGYDDAI